MLPQIEKQLETLAVRTQKELILLHREGAPLPRDTVVWLNMRSWCSSHHHIQAPKRLFTKKSLSKIVSAAPAADSIRLLRRVNFSHYLLKQKWIPFSFLNA